MKKKASNNNLQNDYGNGVSTQNLIIIMKIGGIACGIDEIKCTNIINKKSLFFLSSRSDSSWKGVHLYRYLLIFFFSLLIVYLLPMRIVPRLQCIFISPHLILAFDSPSPLPSLSACMRLYAPSLSFVSFYTNNIIIFTFSHIKRATFFCHFLNYWTPCIAFESCVRWWVSVGKNEL